MAHFRTAILAMMFVIGAAPLVFAQSRIIELQICVDAGAQLGTQQQWMEMLADVGADRVVVQTNSTGAPTIEESQIGEAVVIYIKGSVDGNRLLLPGGTFSIRDKGGISALIQKLRDDGAAVALAEKKAFGLTSDQLVDLNSTLGKPVNFSTKGMATGAALAKISEMLGTEFTFAPAAKRELNGSAIVTEDLKGISAGTAVAVIVRPLGLVFEPQRRQGKSLELMIVDSRESNENWPIGWPLERPPVQVEPKMFEQLALEIRGFALSDTLNAIEQRTGVPFFYDHNALARADIELSAVKVTLVTEKISYMVAVAKLLRQSKPGMIAEIRVDETGKPFLWISTH